MDPSEIPENNGTPWPSREAAGWFLSTDGLADRQREITSEDPMPVPVKPIRSPLLFAGVLTLVLSAAVLAVFALA